MSAAEEMDAIAARLREIAARLRSPELPQEDADGLAREAAELVARAGNELEASREAGDERG